MGKNVLQIPGDDGCVYIVEKGKPLRKLCDIYSTQDIPKNVSETMEEFHLPLPPNVIDEIIRRMTRADKGGAT